MRCKKCGHALGSMKAICPNCGALMNEEQMKYRKEMNGVNNPYMQKLFNMSENKKYKEDKYDYTKDVSYGFFIVLVVVVIAIIIGLVLIKG
jgi:uncharacterized membrane protein YvbJ